MGLFGRKIKDAVPATAVVAGVSGAPDGQGSARCRLNLVVERPGGQSYPVEISPIVAMKRWPFPGQRLPVDVSASDPTRVRVRWDEVETGSQRARAQADDLAARMNQGTTGGQPTHQAPTPGDFLGGPGIPGQTNITVDGRPVSGADAEAWQAMIAQAIGGGQTPQGDPRLTALQQLAALRDSGALSEAEFEAQKARILGGGTPQ